MTPRRENRPKFFARNRKAFLDAAAIALIVLVAYVVTGAFDLWERLTLWTRDFEKYNVDELIFTLFVVALSLAYVAARRWVEYRRELRVRGVVEVRAAQAHSHLIDAVESIPASFMLFDADDRLVLSNSKTHDFFPEFAGRLAPGIGFSDLIRLSVEKGLVPEAAGREEEWLAGRLALHRRPRAVFEERRADGRWLQVFERKTAEGGTVGICTDITELKRHEAELRRAQKMEAMGRLTSGIAHDFSNLLTIILGNLQMLEEGGASAPDELVREAVAAAERGTELTGRLLAFARRQPLAPRPVDLREVVRGMAGLLRRTLGDPIEIETILGPDLWFAVADPAQMESAILNLALNARHAMAHGGRLVIEAANVPIGGQDGAHGPNLPAGAYVMLAVTDTGTGMAPEVAERAFDPFFTTKPEGKGTGLGLSMVYGFVRQSGGDVSIESVIGQGTAVRLYFPRAAGPPASVPPEKAPEAWVAAGGSVLVVEDDPGVRRLAVRILNDQGLTVHAAENGTAALSILDSETPVDLLFTDVMMPGGMSGWDLAREARRRRPGLKVLFTSSMPDPDLGRGAAPGEAAALLRKPYQRQDMLRAIRSMMSAP